VVGTGHGAPAVLACLYLEETLGEYYRQFTADADGLGRLVRSFSWPGGFPSHLTAQTPGAIHEGGELGYSLLHAFGAAFDNPDLLVACVVGDGEAETGALAASWHSPKFLNPATDGAVLPILHLNGYKLSGPAILARMSEAELQKFFAGHGYAMRLVEGDDPALVHRELWEALDLAHAEIRTIQERARSGSHSGRVIWPVIAVRTPKGWTGPKEIDGVAVAGTFHSHQLPIEDPARNPGHLRALEDWLRSYRPEELFDRDGKPVSAVTALLPRGDQRLGKNKHALGGNLLAPLQLPATGGHAVEVQRPGEVDAEGTRILGRFLRDVFFANQPARNFRLFCPDETSSNRLEAVFEATGRAFEQPQVETDEFLSADGRVMEILSEHCCQGWLEGYLLTGRHGVFACYEAFISIIDSMMAQYAKWQKMSAEVPWRPPLASLNYLLTSHIWEQDHNGYSHQGPTFINMMLTKKPAQIRIYLPPDANCLLAIAEHCLRSRGHINLIVASKHPLPQWLDMQVARDHCERGASVWSWASNDDGRPDVVLAAAGDVAAREIVAAAWWLRREVADLRVRVVNVVDLLVLEARGDHPHALDDATFRRLFTESAPVIFAFHGYPGVIHELTYRRPDPERFHVRGYREEGTSTTPFDMLVMNGMSRYDLAIEALERAPLEDAMVDGAIVRFEGRLSAHRAYIREHDQDLPEVTSWRWSDPGSAGRAAAGGG
jgi:xylulose-5-phosphate/fructose-6-phosphate phosphoketolase